MKLQTVRYAKNAAKASCSGYHETYNNYRRNLMKVVNSGGKVVIRAGAYTDTDYVNED